MIEHLKNIGVGIGFISIIIAIPLATNMFFSYIGTEYVVYFLTFGLVIFLSYVLGSLIRTIFSLGKEEN
jgi:hypothetical protein